MITTVITRILVVKHHSPEDSVTRRRLPLDASPMTVRLPAGHVQAIKDLADKYDQDPAWAHRLAVVEGLKALAARGVIAPLEDEDPARLPDSLPPTKTAQKGGSRGREKGRAAGNGLWVIGYCLLIISEPADGDSLAVATSVSEWIHRSARPPHSLTLVATGPEGHGP